MRGRLRLFGCSVVFCMCFGILSAQQPDLEAVIDDLIDELAAADELNQEGLADMEESYRELAMRHIAINRASRRELARLGILSEFQIESIVKYRESHGALMSPSELALIHGFDSRTARLLAPFVSFEISGAEGTKPLSNSLLVRNNLAKERISYLFPNGMLAGGGILLSNWEKSKASASWHLRLEEFPISKNCSISLLAGDYKVHLGQGLTIWNGFNLSGSGSPMAYYKRGAQLLPNSSANSDYYMRGAALRLESGRSSALLFFSKQEDERVCGGSVRYWGGRGTLSLNAVVQQDSYWENHKVREDNIYRYYEGWTASFSVSGALALRGAMLYGEAAVSRNGSPAVLAGVSARPWKGADFWLLARAYDKGYTAPQSGAFSTITTGPHNQYGIDANLRQPLKGEWYALFGLFATYYPWYRYNTPARTYMAGASAGMERKWECMDLNIKLRERWNSNGKKNLLSLRVTAVWRATGALSLKLSAASKLKGGFLSMAPTLKMGSLNLTGAVTLYNAMDWDYREYIYERDLPQSYSSKLLYGKGISSYIFCMYRPVSVLRLYLKTDFDILRAGLTCDF